MPILKSSSRRQFLAHSAAVAAATSIPTTLFAQETMLTRPIPSSGEALPVVGLGSSNIFVRLPPEGAELPKAVIQEMVDQGGRLIDAPPFFGDADPVLGELLTEMQLQQELFLTGKITVSGKQEGIAHLERTERIWNKRPMDLLMVHNMRDMDVQWQTLKDWKEAGRVRYIGVSQTSMNQYGRLEEFIKAEKPDFVEINYSIQEPQSGERILPLALDSGTAIMIARPFSNGRYFGLVGGKELPPWAAEFDCKSWAQFSIKYILGNPAVSCVVTETSKVHHVTDNMRAGYGRLPDNATRKRMSEYIWSL
jgi:diketogulonate reductase-like aldo/keto reductase